MQVLIYYTPIFIFFSCCFYGRIKEKIHKYKLKKITDNLIEIIDGSDITSETVRAICLAENTSNIYEINGVNRVTTSIPLDDIII
tara:strand:- start:82 stop:336 length:255 start_codon:yes stop_codon:yes gene_type:complete